MKHQMRLQPEPFAAIKSGKKTIELRLFDPKRQLIRPGDEICFEHPNGETITAKVKTLHVFPDFETLYRVLPLETCGYSVEEASMASADDMLAYYTKAQIDRYGVVGIELTEVRVC